jgi:hypothetical protein
MVASHDHHEPLPQTRTDVASDSSDLYRESLESAETTRRFRQAIQALVHPRHNRPVKRANLSAGLRQLDQISVQQI